MNQPPTGNESEAQSERPSKSQRKRDSHALQELGEQIATLTPDALQKLGMPEDLIAAIREGQRVKSHEGRRRQMQLVGRLMRNLDEAAVARLRNGFDAATRQSRDETAHLHALERWRDRLLEDDAEVTQWMAAHPATDVQRLRTLLRTARKERQTDTPPRAFREIFQLLKAASAHDAVASTIPGESE